MDELVEDISGKAALVTGASSGMGRAIAIRLVRAGVKIVGLGRDQGALEETQALVELDGGSFTAIRADLAQAGVMERAVSTAIETLGQLDILINNAAVMNTHTPGETARGQWAKLLQINLHAVIEGCEAAIAHMREVGHSGRIVNISSLASRLPGGGVYGASKIALEKYTQELREALESDPIRVSAVIPGGFATNLARGMTEAEQLTFQQNMGARLTSTTPDSQGRTAYFGIADDVARAVHFAIAQPDFLNVSELVIRPAKNIDPSAFRD